MAEQSYLITFTKVLNEDDAKNFTGFKIFGKEQAKLYMKSLKKLAEDDCSFEYDDLQFQYIEEDFSLVRLSASDLKTLEKLFGISFEDGQMRSLS